MAYQDYPTYSTSRPRGHFRRWDIDHEFEKFGTREPDHHHPSRYQPVADFSPYHETGSDYSRFPPQGLTYGEDERYHEFREGRQNRNRDYEFHNTSLDSVQYRQPQDDYFRRRDGQMPRSYDQPEQWTPSRSTDGVPTNARRLPVERLTPSHPLDRSNQYPSESQFFRKDEQGNSLQRYNPSNSCDTSKHAAFREVNGHMLPMTSHSGHVNESRSFNPSEHHPPPQRLPDSQRRPVEEPSAKKLQVLSTATTKPSPGLKLKLVPDATPSFPRKRAAPREPVPKSSTQLQTEMLSQTHRDSSMRLLSVPVDRLLAVSRALKRLRPPVDAMFEVLGKLGSIFECGAAPQQCTRFQLLEPALSAAAVDCVFYDIDQTRMTRALSDGLACRCVGRFNGDGAVFHCVLVRPMKEGEERLTKLLGILSADAVHDVQNACEA